MCIIAIKPQGAKLQSEDTLKAMFSHNPNGAGFMYPHNGMVQIRKGFMDYDSFRQALANTITHIGEDAPIVMHFRITTHGGTCPSNTHPFPLTKKIAEMRATSCSAKVGVVHNGIINIKPRSEDVSDTMEYIASILAPIYRRNKKFWKTQRILNGVADTINGSRMAFLTGDGEIIRVGTWVQDGEYWYSNDSFKPADTRWIMYGWHDDEDYCKYYDTQYYGNGVTDKYESARLSWEKNANIWLKLVPLTDDDIVQDEHGNLWCGEYHAIDSKHRVYEIDIDDAIAYETKSRTYGYVPYDRQKAIYFQLAS